jgi:endonuclease/exonuclease/phosphatase family metal-dependent hydrolase
VPGTKASATRTPPAPKGETATRDTKDSNEEFGHPLIVATYNVNWGNRALAETAQIILKSRADVVCLQETTPELERSLQRELWREYPNMLFRGNGGKFLAERFGLLSKHPVRANRYVPAKHGIFGAWIFELTVGDQIVQLANLHLEPIRPPEPGKLLTIFKVFEETEQIHAAEIGWIFEHLGPELPTVIAGDFNSLSIGAAPKYLRDKGFVDSFAAVNNSPDSQPTWRWPTRWLELSGRIDYIFHSPHFKTIDSRIDKETTSDHSLVVSRLERRRSEATKTARKLTR